VALRDRSIQRDDIELKGDGWEYERITSQLSRLAILAENLWQKKDLEGCRKLFMILQDIVTMVKNSKNLQAQ
jgi:hypothetical protein